MNTIKKVLMLSVIAGLFAACNDDDSKDNGGNDGQKNGVITSLDDPDYDANDLKGAIGADIELPAGEYTLTGGLIVRPPYTLTLNPGTKIKAAAGGTNVYVIVEQGAKLDAQGTAGAPIVFTSNASSPVAGDWGGVILCGYAPISGGGSAVTEVVDHFYGGDDANDSSGKLSHVEIRYSGARINGEKEFNGLTLYGVGKGTTISDIAIYDGDDDTIEFFGGNVNVTNLLCVNAKDDLVDWTQGYKGTITNVYAIRKAGYTDTSSDPRGIEADGNLDGLYPDQTGQSSPTITGMTIVNNADAVFSDVFKIRRGSSVTLTNALVKWGSNAPAPEDFVDCTDSAGDANGSATLTVVASGANLDINDNKAGANNATINVTEGSTGGADTSAFSWTGFSF
ncbi:hypothetical protein [Flavobacterium rhizosphaerae]|uniref:Uncharacterized protein n=1 Tax=Flavobacterium rhizosphaerae TaxID=3163298 RepID=A0ABW8Z1X3_9FLAO